MFWNFYFLKFTEKHLCWKYLFLMALQPYNFKSQLYQQKKKKISCPYWKVMFRPRLASDVLWNRNFSYHKTNWTSNLVHAMCSYLIYWAIRPYRNSWSKFRYFIFEPSFRIWWCRARDISWITISSNHRRAWIANSQKQLSRGVLRKRCSEICSRFTGELPWRSCFATLLKLHFDMGVLL